MIGKQHKNLVRDIRGYIEIMEKSGNLKIEPSDFFIPFTYTSEQNKELPCYLLTKKGCDMVANKLTGEKGILFTAAYVTAFEQMREYIREHQSPQWQQTRSESKTNRCMETDAIKDFVAYAIKQGSEHADRYYCSFSKMANAAVGIQSNKRDNVTVTQLNTLILVESMIADTIRSGMIQDMLYKDIYKACKTCVDAFRQIVRMEFTVLPASQAVSSGNH